MGALRSERARARQRQIDILDRQETALKEIRQYMNSLANAEEMVKALEVNQDAAREALRLVLVGYQAGVKTEVDVTDARRALTEVMGQYYEALADHTKARLNLQVAMGVLGPCQITDYGTTPPRVPIANIEEFAATDYVPPAPIPMPTPERRAPERRDPESRPISRAPAAPAPTPGTFAAPATDAAPASGGRYEPARSEPSLSAAPLPPPPAPRAATVSPAAVQTAHGQTVAAPLPVAVAAVPAPKNEVPLFTIRAREGSGDLPEVARVGQ